MYEVLKSGLKWYSELIGYELIDNDDSEIIEAFVKCNNLKKMSDSKMNILADYLGYAMVPVGDKVPAFYNAGRLVLQKYNVVHYDNSKLYKGILHHPMPRGNHNIVTVMLEYLLEDEMDFLLGRYKGRILESKYDDNGFNLLIRCITDRMIDQGILPESSKDYFIGELFDAQVMYSRHSISSLFKSSKMNKIAYNLELKKIPHGTNPISSDKESILWAMKNLTVMRFAQGDFDE